MLRGGLLVGSLGLAVHLILPQIPGIERSLRLLADASYVLVGVAFLAELASELCYAELLGGLVGAAHTRRPGSWFMLRLTVTGYGAAHILPGGGAAAVTVTYSALRRQGYGAERVGLALATVSVFVYGALGALFSGSLLYMLLYGGLGPVDTIASVFFLALAAGAILFVYATYRRPTLARRAAERGARLAGRLLGDAGLRSWTVRLVSRLGEELRAAGH